MVVIPMLTRFRRRLGWFFRNSRTINNEPINKVSLVVIILVDIFILINVFVGLNDIGNWYVSPSQAYPCYTSWERYRESNAEDKAYQEIQQALSQHEENEAFRLADSYQQRVADNLGEVSDICLQYAETRDQVNTPENQQLLDTLEQKQTEIADLEQANQRIRNQYDSTLLEEIAGQPREQSINQVGAAEAKQELDQNTAQIETLKGEVDSLKNQLVQSPQGSAFINLLEDGDTFTTLENRYDRANFWYPTIRIGFQGIFLLPLLAIAWTVNHYAQRRGYGLIALLSWHLLVIFWVPLIIKLLQFLQVGALFEFFSGIVELILGGLLFLVSYFYIFLIPLLGFGIIKFFQKIVFNTKVQAAGRVQKGRCIRCAKKIRSQDAHCPHCGYEQYVECPACHRETYKFLPHCRECGASQDLSRLR